jgi:MFS family permease
VSSHPGTPSVSRLSPRAWAVFLLVVAADVLDLLSTTVTNIAAPAIVGQLHASEALTPWLGASYALAMGSVLIIGGRLGDRFGCRRLFLAGLAGFACCSAAVAAAPTGAFLVAARIAQGACGGLLIPQGFVLLMRVVPRASMRIVFALFGPLLAASSMSGPLLAGLVIEADPFGWGWRAVFALNAVLAVALAAVAVRAVPPFAGDRSVQIRPGAALTLMAGVGLLLAGLIDGGADGWGVPAELAVACGTVILAVLAHRQSTTATPLLERSLFGNRGFVVGLFFGALFSGAVTGTLYVTVLYLQQHLGQSPFHAALTTAPLTIGILAASFTARSRITSAGRAIVTLGLALFFTGVAALAAVIAVAAHPVPLICAPLFVTGLGMGCCFGTIFAVALGDVTEAQAGSASGVLNAIQQIVSAAGSALMSTVYIATSDTTSDTAGGVQPCLTIALAITAACAAAVPMLPKQGADVH